MNKKWEVNKNVILVDYWQYYYVAEELWQKSK